MRIRRKKTTNIEGERISDGSTIRELTSRNLYRTMMLSAAMMVLYRCILFLHNFDEPYTRRALYDYYSGAEGNENHPIPKPEPTIISNNSSATIQAYMKRGPNFLTATSGCNIAAWVWVTGMRAFSDCNEDIVEKQKLDGNEQKVQAYDTVYVPTKLLKNFVEAGLPNITVPFVLITGSLHKSRSDYIPGWVLNAILDNPLIEKWFCQNIKIHVLHRVVEEVKPKKLASFPFGLQPKQYKIGDTEPMPVFRAAFERHIQLPPKTKVIFSGYLNNYTNPERTKIPYGPKLPLDQYYDQIAQSEFVLSPNGDRPECYRHYEAIAFGAIPITELDPELFGHLKNAPVIFNNTNWNITGEEARDLVMRQTVDRTETNGREMIFEEHWMEYVERVTNRPLRWWDRQGQKKAELKEFVNYTTTTFPSSKVGHQMEEEKMHKQTSVEQENNTPNSNKLATYPFAENDLGIMERHTCFPLKDICTAGNNWFYRSKSSGTGAYQPNFIFQHNLLNGHSIPEEMVVNNSFFFDVDWKQRKSEPSPICQVSSIPNHMVVTSAYLGMAIEAYYQVIGGLYQLWNDASAPWWKHNPSSPHVQLYALTQTKPMKQGQAKPMKQALDTEKRVMPSLQALLAGFTSHPIKNYLNLHNASSGCQCFERLIFCGVRDANKSNPKSDFIKMTDPTDNSTNLAFLPPHNAPMKHIVAGERVGDRRDRPDYEALRVHVRRGAYDVYPNITRKATEMKQNVIMDSLEQLKAAGNDHLNVSGSILDNLRLEEWTMIGFSQRSFRRRWLNLDQIIHHCRTNWLLEHRVVCLEINLDTPYGANPENQITMHAGLDALIGVHGSQNVHSVWMPDRSYTFEILPHLIGHWGGWTQYTHQPTCNGNMIKNTKLNHVGYGLNKDSVPDCKSEDLKHVAKCNDGQKWDVRDFLVPMDVINSFVHKFLFLPSGGTVTTTPPRKCAVFNDLAKQEFVLYNIVCQDGRSDTQMQKQYYRQRASFSHLEKRR